MRDPRGEAADGLELVGLPEIALELLLGDVERDTSKRRHRAVGAVLRGDDASNIDERSVAANEPVVERGVRLARSRAVATRCQSHDLRADPFAVVVVEVVPERVVAEELAQRLPEQLRRLRRDVGQVHGGVELPRHDVRGLDEHPVLLHARLELGRSRPHAILQLDREASSLLQMHVQLFGEHVDAPDDPVDHRSVTPARQRMVEVERGDSKESLGDLVETRLGVVRQRPSGVDGQGRYGSSHSIASGSDVNRRVGMAARLSPRKKFPIAFAIGDSTSRAAADSTFAESGPAK